MTFDGKLSEEMKTIMMKMINGFNSRTHMLLGGKKAHMSDLEIKMTAGFMALRPASLYISIFLPSAAAATTMLLMMKERERIL